MNKIKRTTKPVKATYRPAVWSDDGMTLEDIMRQSWQKRTNLADRIQPVAEQLSVLSSKLMIYGGVTCVQLRIFEKGRHQLAVSLGGQTDDLSEIPVPPPDKDKEFLQESAFHAAIRGNHVAYCGSSLLTPNRFRDYVTWIITEALGPNALNGGMFELHDVPTAEGRRMISGKPISKVKIGGPVGAKQSVAIESNEKTKKKRTVRKIDPGGPSFPRRLLEFLRSEGIADTIPDFNEIEDSRLTVSLEIGFERVQVSSDQAILKDLAALDVVDGDGEKAVSVLLKGGGQIKPNLLIVRETFSMEAINGNIPRETYFQSLANWLRSLAERGELSS